MNVDRHIQCFRRLKDFPEFWIVEIFPLGMGIDDGTFQAQRFNAAFQFFGRAPGILWCDSGKAGKTVGMIFTSLGKLIVAGSSQRIGRVNIEYLYSRRG